MDIIPLHVDKIHMYESIAKNEKGKLFLYCDISLILADDHQKNQ